MTTPQWKSAGLMAMHGNGGLEAARYHPHQAPVQPLSTSHPIQVTGISGSPVLAFQLPQSPGAVSTAAFFAMSPPNFSNLEVIYSPTHTRGRRETGIIEKLLQNFGFIQCCDRQARLFFHFSQYQGGIDELKNGDEVEFESGFDKRTGKPIALNILRLSRSQLVEAVSDSRVYGEVTYSPKHNCIIKPGSCPQTELGRLSYQNKGECFFLSFTPQDVVGDISRLKQGDRVSFRVVTDQRNGSIKAREVRLEESALTPPHQGVVCSMKENFGFIERADCVKEIFFHYSEFNGDISTLSIGDDVKFTIHTRNGKEVATLVCLLPAGTVQFEEVRPETRRGLVIKPIPRAPGRKPNPDDPLPGRVRYQDEFGESEIVFGDRDQHGEYTLLHGDHVTFNLAIDKRDALKRATNVILLEESLRTSGEKRERGSVATLKDGFGFVKCHDKDIRLFFHFSEILDQKAHIKLSDEVEFSIISTDSPDKQNAVRIKIVSMTNRKRSLPTNPIRTSSKADFVSIKDKPNDDVAFNAHFTPSNSVGENGGVEGVVIKCRGWLLSIKDTFGFVETEQHDREIFFHISALQDNLNVGDEVQYEMKFKGTKYVAENIMGLTVGTIAPQSVSPTIFKGEVVRPLRCANPNQEDYQGLIKLMHPTESSECGGQSLFPFGIIGLVNKFDFLQEGDMVDFKLATITASGEKRAHSVQPLRKRLQSRISSVKGEFGFIDYDTGDNKQLFFHQSEVLDGVHLKVNDEVEFEIIRNQKNGKPSACKVKRISTTHVNVEKSTDRLSHRVRTLSLSNQEVRVKVIREPINPDGSHGFSFQRTPVPDHDLLSDDEDAVAGFNNVAEETEKVDALHSDELDIMLGMEGMDLLVENGRGDTSRPGETGKPQHSSGDASNNPRTVSGDHS